MARRSFSQAFVLSELVRAARNQPEIAAAMRRLAIHQFGFSPDEWQAEDARRDTLRADLDTRLTGSA